MTKGLTFRGIAVLLVTFWIGLSAASAALAAEKPKLTTPPEAITGLFLGNSYTYYNNSMHLKLRKLAGSLDVANQKKYYYKMMGISGSSLKHHALGAAGMIEKFKHKKKKGPWGVVVLQGHSREPINPKWRDSFASAARTLDKTIRGSGSKTVFFMTWAYKAKPEMSEALEDAYTKIGNELNAYVVPVGMAFRLALYENPNMELYHRDGKHPSPLGSYLSAAVFYAALTGKSPEASTFTDGLRPDQAAFARRIAWKAVKQYYGW